LYRFLQPTHPVLIL